MALARRIIPVFDINKGAVVKGIRLHDVEDKADPVAVAAAFEAQGADEIALIDVSSGNEREETLADVLRKLSERIFIPITAGGGVSNLQDIKRMLAAGADSVMLNTAAVLDQDFLREAVERFGGESLVGAVDVQRTQDDSMPWEVITHGGRRRSGKDARVWVQQLTDYGVGEILVTSLDRDGSKKGFDLALVQAMAEITTAPLVVAGGAGSPEDIAEVLGEGLADGVMIASIFHSGEYNIDSVKQHLAMRGIHIRP